MTAETILQLFNINPKDYNANLLIPVQNSPGGLGSTGAIAITDVLGAFTNGIITTISQSFAVGGSIDARTWSVTFYRVGNMVMMNFPTILAETTTPGGSILSASSFPIGFTPLGAASLDIYHSATVIDGDSTGNQIKPGVLQLYPAPSVSLAIFPYDPGHFSNAYCGIKGSTIMYYGS